MGNKMIVDQQLISRFADSWAQGARPSVEEFCSSFSASEDGDEGSVDERLAQAVQRLGKGTVIALLQTEVAARGELGDTVDVSELHQRFPMLDEEVLTDIVNLPALPEPEDPALLLPTRYQKRSRLGSGGVGEVWKVWDAEMQREVAIKTILPQYRTNATLNRRLEREALITGDIQHPGIPAIHGFGRLADGSVHVVMKQVEGETLADLLAANGGNEHDLPSLLRIFEQLAKTVAFAHSLRYVHRDLKPQNIMVGRFGEVQVLDWGMAKRIGESTESDSSPETTEHDALLGSEVQEFRGTSSLTREGDVFGTPAYMAPEQARGDQSKVGTYSDVFSLGAILFEILCGTRLYSGSADQILQKAVDGNTGAASTEWNARNIDDKLRQICESCIASDATKRPQDASWVAGAITDYLTGTQVALEKARLDRRTAEVQAIEEGKRRRTASKLSAGIVLATLLGAVGVVWQWNSAVVARDKATEQGQLAQERFLLAKQTVDEYLTEVASSQSLLGATPGTQQIRRNLLRKAKSYYESFIASDPDSNEMKSQLADAYQSLGKISRELESNDATLKVLLSSLELREELIDSGFDRENQVLKKLEALNELGAVYDLVGDLEAVCRELQKD